MSHVNSLVYKDFNLQSFILCKYWQSITIHKSQGKSIPNLETDCKFARLPWRIWVAVDRAITTNGLRVLNFSPPLCKEYSSKVHISVSANDIGNLCDSLHCCQSHCCAERTVLFEKDDSVRYEWDSDSFFKLKYAEKFSLDRLDCM